MLTHEEEKQARDLYEVLRATLAPASPAVDVSIEGAGVHWNCYAKCSNRMAVIDCFGQSGLAVTFKTNAETEAMGRTRLEQELISAVSGWLQGLTLKELYEAYEFIDRYKRFLERLREDATTTFPELASCAAIRLNEQYGGFWDLQFVAKDRSCRLHFIGGNQFPVCQFYWDEAYLFEISADSATPLPLILKRWLCDYAMPSDLEQELAWLEVGKLAKYYEEGRGIEGEFVLSWDSVERFYRDWVNIPQKSDILKMVAQMRERGYDRTL